MNVGISVNSYDVEMQKKNMIIFKSYQEEKINQINQSLKIILNS